MKALLVGLLVASFIIMGCTQQSGSSATPAPSGGGFGSPSPTPEGMDVAYAEQSADGAVSEGESLDDASSAFDVGDIESFESTE